MTKIKCPACKCLASANAEVCRACGAALHDPPQNQKIVTKAKCTACGCLESASAEVCRACGAALQSVPVQEISFTQAVAGIFSWMEGKGFHGTAHDEGHLFNNIIDDSNNPSVDYADISDAFINVPLRAFEEGPVIHDLWSDPVYSFVEGNIYNTE